ncbi:MAG TPA: hypothetical protein VKT31_13895 [Solirubrobacteraceae bacterium]|nr:hypothetical protein [Solirubrobacteraceae bacterium]
MRPLGLAAGLALALLAAACGGVSKPPTLAAAAVPYLPSSARTLTVAGLAREAGDPALASELRTWGYRAGEQRYFQGESRRLQVVDSRTLRFGSAGGASTFVSFARAHVNVFLGSFPSLRVLAAGGRRGFLAIGQPCQCHLANPAFLAVLARAGTVTWLEINGPRATVQGLDTLLRQAP